ncbi:glycosyl hydrolase [Niabella sp. CJ426]|uniref:glycosyl hydrolase n=1 Tax=Niabella sp. CJ426 TaxID=3393740 RepID=UPI003D0409D4
MRRKSFLKRCSILTAGGLLYNQISWALENKQVEAVSIDQLYQMFKSPDMVYRPFVRWWWNGDKVEKDELLRELKLLKDAGIGGVEINPIKFPQRTDDMGIKSLMWLSKEWTDALDYTLTEAKKMGLTCDLIVGSGWPFGAEYLEGEERADIVTIAVKKVSGLMEFEAPIFDFLKEADPAVTSPYPHRESEVMKVFMVPDPMSDLSEAIDLSDQIASGFIKVNIPRGNYAIYALVKTKAFLQVINGAPGANGQVLNHFNKAAVEKYLNHMSDAIIKQIGSLKGRVRSFFVDSLELEGANWTADMADEFKKRRGYDLMPYLPLIMWRIGGMGNVYDYNYGTKFTDKFQETIERVRCDFDRTKVELLRERFLLPFQNWCNKNGVLSRAQAYGRGYHPLESSLVVDIPEGETWIKYGVGEEISEIDYRIGRAYTQANKFVSSGAHLSGKRLISCEECTNTDMVFNATLQMIKLASDQSFITGITHSVYHGFNYSPKNAPFPGWIRYGNYMSEHNTYWPFFKLLNDYKARVSALLQHADMYADIAILPPLYDSWGKYGAPNEPFPSLTYPDNLSLVWEAVQLNGNGTDYVSDNIINKSEISNGFLKYGDRKYHTLILVKVESLEPETAKKIAAFVNSGGKIVCVDFLPNKSIGLTNAPEKSMQVKQVFNELLTQKNRCIVKESPKDNYVLWYRKIQEELDIKPYLTIENGNPFIQQVRYSTPDCEIFLILNSNYNKAFDVTIKPADSISKNTNCYYWDAVSGNMYTLDANQGIALALYPADMRVIIFSKKKYKNAQPYTDVRAVNDGDTRVNSSWDVSFNHIDGTKSTTVFNKLIDLKETTEYRDFAGTVVYKNKITITDQKVSHIDLGNVQGISQLFLNGKDLGTHWYGRHLYDVVPYLKQGENNIEIRVTTTMGNYMKSLSDNPVAQYWTNGKRKPQPVWSLGLIGPVTLF